MSKRKRVSTVSREGGSDLESPVSAIGASQKKVRWDKKDDFDVAEMNEDENAEEESQVGQKVSPGVITTRDLRLMRTS